jgi:exopolysaccharide biosynthesis polyprenyl glycosylphosphotransferase
MSLAEVEQVLDLQPASHGLVGQESVAEQAVNARRLRPLLLRAAAPPYLVAADVAVFVLIVLLHWPHPVQALVLAVIMFCFWLGGLYRSRLRLSILDDFPYVLGGVLAGLVVEVAAAGLLPHMEPGREQVPRLVALLVMFLIVKSLAYAVVRWARCSGRVRHTALVIGAGHVGMRLTHNLQEHQEFGLDVVGFVDSRPRVQDERELPAPLLGGQDHLAELIEDFAVRVVIVAFGSVRESELVDILRTCDRLRCEIFFIPRLFEMSYTTRDMDQAWGIPLVRVRRAPYRRLSWRMKRLVDVLISGTALLLLLPLMALIAFAVRLEGGPGVIFRQHRVGVDGREITVLKFRSLRPVSDDESATRWNIAHDDRLGPVGRMLRKSSLDELPQLWNILIGSMTLVGPRPERPHFVKEFGQKVPRYMARHRVPAGLTGWAQVHGLRGDTSIEHRAGFDNYYIENWSLWGDFKIMMRTVEQLLRVRGG